MESEKVKQLIEMGFSEEQAIEALMSCNYDLQKSISYLFGEPVEDKPENNPALSIPQNDLQLVSYQDTVSISNPEDIPNFQSFNREDSATTASPPAETQTNDTNNINDLNNNNERSQAKFTRRNLSTIPGHLGDRDRSKFPEAWEHGNSGQRSCFRETCYARLETLARDFHPSVVTPVTSFLENYIIPIIIVASQIDCFRQVILRNTDFDYGYDPKWYSCLSELKLEVPESIEAAGLASTYRFMIEIQRLVAYCTEGFSIRPFISAYTVLTSLPADFRKELSGERIEDAEDLCKRLYYFLNTSYEAIFGGSNEISKIFESHVESIQEDARNDLYVIPIDFETRSSNLYESLASMFWHEEEFIGSVRFVDVAPILTIQLCSDDDCFQAEPFCIHEEFYPEVFSAKFAHVVTDMAKKRAEISRERLETTQQFMSLNSFEGKKIKTILSNTVKVMENSKHKEVASDLSNLTDSIREEAASLTERLSVLGEQFAELDLRKYENILNRIRASPQGNELKKYVLVGILLSDTHYFFRNKYHKDDEDSWYYFTTTVAIDRRVVDYESDMMKFEGVQTFVLHASKDSTRPIVLMYASEEAFLEEIDIPLSENLKSFFAKDNEALLKHLERKARLDYSEDEVKGEKDNDMSSVPSSNDVSTTDKDTPVVEDEELPVEEKEDQKLVDL
ncbi:uncharacterized protein RJT20DRAFT_92059 [Scheffersomyces xylosifermentans]|uniref:uncharacterized protein n=1 Tax=Scheffersomyces xylosifermentans TaxID=1304137 RepID=UPI00315C7EF7